MTAVVTVPNLLLISLHLLSSPCRPQLEPGPHWSSPRKQTSPNESGQCLPHQELNCPGELMERLTSGHMYHWHWMLQALVSKITAGNIVPVWISKMGQNHPLLFPITMENIQGVLKITTQDWAVEGKENVWKNLCFFPFGHQRMLYWRELKDQAVRPTHFPDKNSEAQKQMGCLL